MSSSRSEVGFLLAVCLVVAAAAVVPLVGAGSTPATETNATVSVETDFAANSVTAPESGGTATVGSDRYDTVQAAVDAATPGETVVLNGRFSERLKTDDLAVYHGEGVT